MPVVDGVWEEPVTTSTPHGAVRNDVCEINISGTSVNSPQISGITRFDVMLNTGDGLQPVAAARTGVAPLLRDAAAALQSSGKLPAPNEKFGATVLPCEAIAKAMRDRPLPDNVSILRYTHVETDYDRVHGLGSTGLSTGPSLRQP